MNLNFCNFLKHTNTALETGNGVLQDAGKPTPAAWLPPKGSADFHPRRHWEQLQTTETTASTILAVWPQTFAPRSFFWLSIAIRWALREWRRLLDSACDRRRALPCEINSWMTTVRPGRRVRFACVLAHAAIHRGAFGASTRQAGRVESAGAWRRRRPAGPVACYFSPRSSRRGGGLRAPFVVAHCPAGSGTGQWAGSSGSGIRSCALVTE